MAAESTKSDADELLKVLKNGIEVKRVKSSKIHEPAIISIDESHRILRYPPSTNFLGRLWKQCTERTHKTGMIKDVPSILI